MTAEFGAGGGDEGDDCEDAREVVVAGTVLRFSTAPTPPRIRSRSMYDNPFLVPNPSGWPRVAMTTAWSVSINIEEKRLAEGIL